MKSDKGTCINKGVIGGGYNILKSCGLDLTMQKQQFDAYLEKIKNNQSFSMSTSTIKDKDNDYLEMDLEKIREIM